MKGDLREGAAERVFSGELNRSFVALERGDPVIPEVLTPTGAWCRRIFLVGALTEVTTLGGMVHRARLSDPTGSIDLVLRPNNLPPADVLSTLTPPAFVAVTGSVRLYGKKVVIQPDMLLPVQRQERDAWVLFTAERTLRRMEVIKATMSGEVADAAAAAALRHYHTSREDLQELAALVRAAVESVSPAEKVIPETEVREAVGKILAGQPGAVEISWIMERAAELGISGEEVRRCLQALLAEGECYAPRNGFVRLL
jgi:RPA family protein